MATTLRLRKRGGAHVLDGIASPTATLTFGRGMRTGTITVDGKALPIEVDSPMRSGVVLGGSAPVLRLAPHEPYLPGRSGTVRWQLTRAFRSGYRATLVRGGDRMEFSLPRFQGKSVEVTVDGDWDELELIALAGCFALLSCRRGDSLRAAAVVGAIGPHSR